MGNAPKGQCCTYQASALPLVVLLLSGLAIAMALALVLVLVLVSPCRSYSSGLVGMKYRVDVGVIIQLVDLFLWYGTYNYRPLKHRKEILVRKSIKVARSTNQLCCASPSKIMFMGQNRTGLKLLVALV